MLVFAENAWHILAGALVFIFGIIFALKQNQIFGVPKKRALALYMWHSFFCIFYFIYSKSNAADATTYYLHSLSYNEGFKFGSAGVYYLSSLFTQGLNFSYGNLFLLYNIIGFFGLIAFASSVQHVTRNHSAKVRRIAVLYLFLPGLSFWSVAVGKDSLTFMAAGLATWAAIDLQRRFPAMAVGVLLYLIPRPHMAGMLLLSLLVSLLLSSKIGILKKILLLTVFMPVTLAGIQFGLNHAGLDNLTDLDAIDRYFDARQSVNLDGSSSVDISGMILPIKMITYLFRPFFFDAQGLMGLLISLENLALSALCVAVMLRRRRTPSNLGRFELSFYITFTLISWIILSNTTANLGIAIRQKIMFTPMLVVLLLSMWPRQRKPRNVF